MIVRPIAGGVEVLAPAKLNLFLEVLGRRPDGYHEIETLMVAVDLYDTLTVRRRPVGSDHPAVRRPDACRPGARTWWSRRPNGCKAAAGCPRGARIEPAEGDPGAGGAGRRLERRGGDPGGPGPALGPADARPSGSTRWRRRSAATWPSSCTAPAAVCRGRGERVEPVDPAASRCTSCWSVRRVGVSTADVYRNLTPPERPRPIGPVLEALADGGPAALGRSLFNRLQPVAETLRPELVRVRDALANLGPSLDGSLMSGSGSAYFGLCRDRDAARRGRATSSNRSD